MAQPTGKPQTGDRPPLQLSGMTKTQAAIAIAEVAMKCAHEDTGLSMLELAAGFATAAIAASVDVIGITATHQRLGAVLASLKEQIQ